MTSAKLVLVYMQIFLRLFLSTSSQFYSLKNSSKNKIVPIKNHFKEAHQKRSHTHSTEKDECRIVDGGD